MLQQRLLLLITIVYCLSSWFDHFRLTLAISENDFMRSAFTNYKKIPPGQQLGSGPTTVQLGIYINSFDSINEQEMDFAISIYLRQNWTDPRLAYTHEPALRNRTFLKLEDALHSRIWLPDVYFRNEKAAKFHFITVPNRMMRVYSSGVVFFVTKITATLSCPMNLEKYPLDTQVCPMYLESFGYGTSVVQFLFRPNNPVDMESDLQLSQFQLVKWNLKNCTGSNTCLKIEFVLKRETGFYMVQVYVPTVLIVIMSWITFWIHADAIPARTSIGLLTVLTMTTKSSAAGASLPKVSYIKAIDVWMSTCLIFVFASLLEFAVVHVLARRYAQEQQQLQQQQQQQQQPQQSTTPATTPRPSQQPTGTFTPKGHQPLGQTVSNRSSKSGSEVEMRLLSAADEKVTDISAARDDANIITLTSSPMATVRWRSSASNPPAAAAATGAICHQETSMSPAGLHAAQGRRSSLLQMMPFEDFALTAGASGSNAGPEMAMIDAQDIAHLTSVPAALPCPHDPGAPYHLCQRCLTCRKRAPAFQAVDQFSRAFFPILFGLFNAAYWIFYLVILP